MALRYLAGKLRVPAGAALRRAKGSRGVASRSHKLESGKEQVTSELCNKEDLQRMAADNEAMMQARRLISEASWSRERYERLETLYVSGGALIGLFVGTLMLRYDNRNGGKFSDMVCGLRKE